jgi:hypothetical protein
MKEYSQSISEFMKKNHENADRTAFQNVSFSYRCRVYPSREAMARAIRKQQKRAPHSLDYHALVPLKDGEGH